MPHMAQIGATMPDPNPSGVTPAGTATPAPTGGQPAPATPAVPGEVIKAPAVSPIISKSAPGDAPKPTPSPAAQPAGVSPAPGVKPEQTQVPITALHEERTKRQNLELELQQLRDTVQQYAGVQQHQQQQQAPQETALRLEIDKLWDTDPKKAVQAEIMVAMNWRDQVEAQLSAQSAQLASKYSDFNTYRPQAENYVRSLPVDQRADPRVMEVAYLVVRGQNVDQIIEQQKTDLYRQFQSGELASQFAQPAGTFTAPVSTAGPQLTQDQLNAASMMGLTAEAYASAMVHSAQPAGR